MSGFMATPRNTGTCPICGHRLPLNSEGKLVEHGTIGNGKSKCPGSFSYPKEKE